MPIGTLNEKPLHAALKDWCFRPGDLLEVPIDGYVVDLLRGDLIIEIQTGSFSAIRRKLRVLTATHRVRLVHPIPRELWLVKYPHGPAGPSQRRKSPKRRGFDQVFDQLVSFPGLLANPNFEIELVATREEEIRHVAEGRRGRRRGGWRVVERRLIEILETCRLRRPDDLLSLMPSELPERFQTSDIARALGCTRRLGQKAAYCLRRGGVAAAVAKDGNAIVYSRTTGLPRPGADPGLPANAQLDEPTRERRTRWTRSTEST
ncbi:MAG: hypothetical protein QGI83_08625 [Candidatus Latescibacteria bacterium]|jgi:hypothetical protein|nr:hypothetical protein [Candidatus Latescibacterota bacterium]